MKIIERDIADPRYPFLPPDGPVLYRKGRIPLEASVTGWGEPMSIQPTPSVSVIICSRDRAESLRACLESLQEQLTRPDEILVVDNASVDRLAYETIARQCGANYLREQRPGVRFARNRGLKGAAGDIVAFIDDDCRPVVRWLTAVRDAFVAMPHAGCCTGPVLAGDIETEAQRLMEARGGFSKGFARRVFTRDSHVHQWRNYPVQAWLYGSGGNMAFRRRMLLAAGGFAEELPRGEDLDAFFHILRDGHALVYEPCAVVFHNHVREYAGLRSRLFGWGYGYTAYLMRIVHAEPAYRKKAIRELAGFLTYQWRDRLWPALRHRHSAFPVDLIAAELLGAIAGIPGYWRDRGALRRR